MAGRKGYIVRVHRVQAFFQDGTFVDQINLWGFYSVGGYVRPIGNLTASTRASEALSILAQADLALRFIDDNDKDLIELERSLPLAHELRDLIKDFTEAVVPKETSETPAEYVVGEYYANKFADKLKSFEAVLRSELAYVHAYGVSDKGILSTTKLIQSAELAIPQASRKHLSMLALSDIQSAGIGSLCRDLKKQWRRRGCDEHY
jgi:hypothetical protein